MTCCYALIYRARGPYEEIFVLTFKAYGLNSHLTSLQCACRLKSFFESFFSRASRSQLRAVSLRAISYLACQTVFKPRSRLVDFNMFYEESTSFDSTGTRAWGTKARVLDMLLVAVQSVKGHMCFTKLFLFKMGC